MSFKDFLDLTKVIRMLYNRTIAREFFINNVHHFSTYLDLERLKNFKFNSIEK